MKIVNNTNTKFTIISISLQVSVFIMFNHSFLLSLLLFSLALCPSTTSIATGRSDELLTATTHELEDVRNLILSLLSTSSPASASLPHPKVNPAHVTYTPTPEPDTPEFFLDPTTYEPTSEPTSEPATTSAEVIATHSYTSGHIFGIHSAEDAGLLALIVITIVLFLCLMGVLWHYYYFFYKKLKTEEEKELMYKYSATRGDVEAPQRV